MSSEPSQGGDEPRGRRSLEHGGGQSGEAVQDLSQVVRELQQQLTSPAVLDRVVAWAVQVIPGAQHASISLTKRRRTITSAAASSQVAARFDELQQSAGQGPCLEAMYDHLTIRVHDLATEQRWSALARRWAEVGVRSAVCLQLFVHEQDLGALNVLSEQVGAFDNESEDLGLLVATHSAVAVAGALRVEGLNRANTNRTVIGQAQGIIMERLKVDAEVAFALLARVSQDTNRKLIQVAEDLVTTGELPRHTTR